MGIFVLPILKSLQRLSCPSQGFFFFFLVVLLKRNVSVRVCTQSANKMLNQSANKMPSVITESMYRDRMSWFYHLQTICFIVFPLFLSFRFKVSQGNDEELFPTSQDNFKNVFSIHIPIPYSPCNIQFCLCWTGTCLDIYWKAAWRERHKARL